MGFFGASPVFAQADEAAAEPGSVGRPVESGELSWDVLGGERWYYPRLYAGLTEVFTDNVFNTRDEKESDLTSIVTLGARLSLPRGRQQPFDLGTSNIAPGGLKLSRPAPEAFTRYRAQLNYRADMSYHSRFSSEDATAHTAEGLLQYNSVRDLTAEAVDKFEKSFDPRGTSESSELDKFLSNHFGALLSYALGDRITLRADYSNYKVDYESVDNDFRDRTDNGFSAYVYYKVRPRTSLFVEYGYMDIDYDLGNDSREGRYLAGLTYKITGKSDGTVKAGWGEKDFVDPGQDDTEDVVFEGVLDHHIDERKSVALEGTMRTTESNVSSAGYIFSKALTARYGHIFTERVEGSLKLSYSDDEYRNTDEGRRDDVYTGSIELAYKFNRWLRASAGYVYTRRDSSDPDFDFASNVLFLGVFASM